MSLTPEAIARKLDNLLRSGKVVKVDNSAARVKVNIGFETGWLPWLTPAAAGEKIWRSPTVGEQVLILSPGGDLANGFVLTGIFSKNNPAPANSDKIYHHQFKNGDTIIHNSETGDLTATIKGSATITADKNIVATAKENINATAEGDVTITAGGKIVNTVGGSSKGVVQGDCICPFTGSPHIMVSATVEASE